MRIPPVVGRVLGIYLVKAAEYLIQRFAEKPTPPLPFDEVRRINEIQKRAGRASAKTVKLPRTPNRYDE